MTPQQMQQYREILTSTPSDVKIRKATKEHIERLSKSEFVFTSNGINNTVKTFSTENKIALSIIAIFAILFIILFTI